MPKLITIKCTGTRPSKFEFISVVFDGSYELEFGKEYTITFVDPSNEDDLLESAKGTFQPVAQESDLKDFAD